ncbi:hypothetical protein FNF27_06417 [Cafeteria roenbergensis]|uniref:Uncharacterized protein n=1 Tax=Cafeteria roenbergensis TaxID=33653 RepID=A0A5A8E4B3_CAFRO|nr:hypothetical protein FNF27_06417 [Cafeteria roenbergensis]
MRSTADPSAPSLGRTARTSTSYSADHRRAHAVTDRLDPDDDPAAGETRLSTADAELLPPAGLSDQD